MRRLSDAGAGDAAGLDPRLARDTVALVDTAAARVRLARGGRWPWLILVQRDAGATELHDLPDAALVGFARAVAATSAALKAATGCDSVNVAMLGNVVPALHCHVVARSAGDPNWPGPVWGHGTPEPRAADAPLPPFAAAVRDALAALG